MARVAHEVMVEAERAFRRADALSTGMEPYLLKRVNDSSIYGYTNERADRNVPPGDVLLAAALAAGISIDRKLGIADGDPRGTDVEELRAQISDMREELATLRAELTGKEHPGTERPEETRDPGVIRAERIAQRRAWARRSEAAAPPSPPVPSVPRGGRGPRL